MGGRAIAGGCRFLTLPDLNWLNNAKNKTGSGFPEPVLFKYTALVKTSCEFSTPMSFPAARSYESKLGGSLRKDLAHV